MLRAEAEVKAIKDGRKDLGIKELEILLERYKQFQFMALKVSSWHFENLTPSQMSLCDDSHHVEFSRLCSPADAYNLAARFR